MTQGKEQERKTKERTLNKNNKYYKYYNNT